MDEASGGADGTPTARPRPGRRGERAGSVALGWVPFGSVAEMRRGFDSWPAERCGHTATALIAARPRDRYALLRTTWEGAAPRGVGGVGAQAMLVFGGYGGGRGGDGNERESEYRDARHVFLSDSYVLDPTGSRWTRLHCSGTKPTARAYHAAAAIAPNVKGDPRVVIFGGWHSPTGVRCQFHPDPLHASRPVPSRPVPC